MRIHADPCRFMQTARPGGMPAAVREECSRGVFGRESGPPGPAPPLSARFAALRRAVPRSPAAPPGSPAGTACTGLPAAPARAERWCRPGDARCAASPGAGAVRGRDNLPITPPTHTHTYIPPTPTIARAHSIPPQRAPPPGGQWAGDRDSQDMNMVERGQAG